MSTRTRSSTRIQALQAADDHNVPTDTDTRSDGPDEPFNLEETEQEIWDEVRDEHYDIIEQLPLTIHRQLTLLRQLDHQAHDYSIGLLPTIKEYIGLRQRPGTRGHQPTQLDASPSQTGSPHDGVSPPNVTHLRYAHSGPAATPTTTSTRGLSTSPQGKASARRTSREMLSHIAWLSEEYLRSSREKVNIAQTVHDSVDRHIRLLDQFIKEQEASLGPEPNAPVMLSMSELFVPKWSRSTRVSMSPMLDEEEQAAGATQVQPEGLVPHDRSNRRRPPKGRKQKEKEKEKDKEEHADEAPLRITLPPPQHGTLVDPNEPTWCYCNRVSFGEMIGCDNPECRYEWFHLECVGLKEVPEDDEWYCSECIQQQEAKGRRK